MAEGVGLEPTSPLRGAGFQDQVLANSEHPSSNSEIAEEVGLEPTNRC